MSRGAQARNAGQRTQNPGAHQRQHERTASPHLHKALLLWRAFRPGLVGQRRQQVACCALETRWPLLMRLRLLGLRLLLLLLRVRRLLRLRRQPLPHAANTLERAGEGQRLGALGGDARVPAALALFCVGAAVPQQRAGEDELLGRRVDNQQRQTPLAEAQLLRALFLAVFIWVCGGMVIGRGQPMAPV